MNIFPQFAEMDKGSFKQQDADECFQGILTTLEPALPAQGGSLIDKLFGFHVRYTWKNTQTTEEPETYTDELLRRLPCIIDNQSHPINQLFEGIKVGLEGEVEKYSPTLESNAVYTKIGKLATLPDYLIVQNIRFIWKDLDTTTRNQAQKAKILRAVTFPKVLDMSDFCVPELQEDFKKIREKIKTSDEQKIKKNEEEFEAYKKSLEKTELDTAKITKQFRESKREQEIKDHDSDLWHDLAKGTPTGNYELIGVITHKGRGADSGHYVGWTHYKGDEWYRYDDDDVTKVKIEDVLALRGGGDWHMAYYLIYRKLVSDL
jgi:ubiquitin carboxyl-terminal hydrolase 14